MRTFSQFLEGKSLYQQIEAYIDKLYDNDVGENEAQSLTTKAFADEIINLGAPRNKTALDIELGHNRSRKPTEIWFE